MASEYNHASSTLTVEEFKELVYSCLVHTSKSRNDESAHDGVEAGKKEKFVVEPKELICGEFEHAAKGFYKLLNVNKSYELLHANAGVSAIEFEVKALPCWTTRLLSSWITSCYSRLQVTEMRHRYMN